MANSAHCVCLLAMGGFKHPVEELYRRQITALVNQLKACDHEMVHKMVAAIVLRSLGHPVLQGRGTSETEQTERVRRSSKRKQRMGHMNESVVISLRYVLR